MSRPGGSHRRDPVPAPEGLPTTPRSQRPTWAERRAEWDTARRQPAALRDLAARVEETGIAAGLARVGIASCEPLLEARRHIQLRNEAGHSADMGFTFKRPESATTPAALLPGAAAVVVGAFGYLRSREHTHAHAGASDPVERSVDGVGQVARYQWEDYYGQLRISLGAVAALLRSEGWRARVLADDNALVDRAIAHRAGIGWFGKNANLLVPSLGSWFVLGSVVTDAPLPAAAQPIDDQCGACTRCLPACPTQAIVAPGVVDARRCLAWLVQAPGSFPPEFRSALGSRIYGCDDCQEVCPENRLAARRNPPPNAPGEAIATADLLWVLSATDGELLGSFGRWWLPDRNPDVLRRNAAIALGNVGDPSSLEVRNALGVAVREASDLTAEHSVWALHRLDERQRA